MRGDGKIEFIKHKNQITQLIEQGWPLKRIHAELKLKISYRQFIRLVNPNATPKIKTEKNPPDASSKTTTKPATESRKTFRHNPTITDEVLKKIYG